MAECDRCGKDREIKYSVAHIDGEYTIKHICSMCYSKLLQFFRGHDTLEQIPLEEVEKKR